MSLKIWLPLKNLDNKGTLNTLTFAADGSGITTDSNGKTGNCYKRTTKQTSGRIYSNTGVYLPKDITMCCWTYVTDCVGDTANGLITNHDHSQNSGVGITVKQVSTSDYRVCCNTGYQTGRTFNTYYGNTNIKDAWHHLALTYSRATQTLKLYCDGNLEYTLNNYNNYAVNSQFMLFEWSVGYNDTAYRPACKLDDVRVYDECLSAGEIKEISRAMLLYWPLDKNSVIALNMIDHMDAGGRTTIVNSYAFDAEFTANDTYAYINVSGALTLGNSYTLSFDVEGLPSGSTWAWRLWNSDNYSISVTKNGHYVYTFSPTADKLPSGYSLTRFLFDDGARTGATGTVRFKNFKIEESLVDTPFRTRSFGQKVYDGSGLIKNSCDASASTGCFPIVRSDSPRNSTSCWFNTNGKNLKMNTTSFLARFTTGTVEWWAKLVTGGSSGVLPFTGQTTGYYLAASEGWTKAFYNGNVSAASGYTIKYYVDGVEDNTPPGADSKWHHYVVTGVNMSSWTQLWLNNYGNSSAWNASNIYYSDVKFYNTVLSAADVSTLYHNFASIYNDGSLASYDMKEN